MSPRLKALLPWILPPLVVVVLLLVFLLLFEVAPPLPFQYMGP